MATLTSLSFSKKYQLIAPITLFKPTIITEITKITNIQIFHSKDGMSLKFKTNIRKKNPKDPRVINRVIHFFINRKEFVIFVFNSSAPAHSLLDSIGIL